MTLRVFISHSSADKPAVLSLAAALRERGIEAWVDRWEINPGDDIVAAINAGLHEADAGLIVFSAASRESRWVEAEVSYLTWARIEERKVLIPIVVGEGAEVPPLLRPLARLRVEDVDAIADALRTRRSGPPPLRSPALGRIENVTIALQRVGEAGVRCRLSIGGQPHGEVELPRLPPSLVAAQARFLTGFRDGVRGPAEAHAAELESVVADLGRQLQALCLPGTSGEAVAELVDGASHQVGVTVAITFEADSSALLGLPFEALRLPDDRLLATLPPVVVLRRPLDLASMDRAALPGPLKILVAVGAPDESRSGSAILDPERELQAILDAVEPARRLENVEVRVLEVGGAPAIAEAFATDAYHVLHLSCHGLPGLLELEDEDGGAVPTTARQLLDPLIGLGRPLPLVLLNTCHGGVVAGQTGSFTEELLRRGVPAVLAMHTSVSDSYATRLARTFYEHLARLQPPLPSRALALARRELEGERQAALARGEIPVRHQPEYATAGLYVAGDERPLVDFGADRQPLTTRPIFEIAGPVLQLRPDDLIGRRQELRRTLGRLREPESSMAGVVLTGIGGVGKSAVAGRVMQRLKEEGWLLAAHLGRFDLDAICVAAGVGLLGANHAGAKQAGALLADSTLEERLRSQLLAEALSQAPLILVLDDFEQNLTPGGSAFRDETIAAAMGDLAAACKRGRLLLTCRYPVPGLDDKLEQIAVGPLSHAESRKLLLRLPALADREPSELAEILRSIGRHPRVLELLDALLRGGNGRIGAVTQKLQELREALGRTADAPPVADLTDALQEAILLGARDVFLAELFAIVDREGLADPLLQLAVSNLPVSPAGLARLLGPDPSSSEGDLDAAERAIQGLAALSLVHRFPDGNAWVHRWTAEGLQQLSDASAYRARCNRAGRYRMWMVENDSHRIEDGIEAIRNHLDGEDWDAATSVTRGVCSALESFHRSVALAALAAEVRQRLPDSHQSFAAVTDLEARALIALGFTERAMPLYTTLLELGKRRTAAEPQRADHQRDLSVSFNKLGDLYRDLGQGEQARKAFLDALAIRERLANAEPQRADYQRDLSVSFNKLGDLYRDLGQGEQARKAFLDALAIAERLANAEPQRADYQRDLSVSFNKLGDLYRDLGQGEQARKAFLDALAIAERLANAEPQRADYQRDLVVSLVKLGEGPESQGHLRRALAIVEELDRDGRLSPTDTWVLSDLRRRVAELRP